MGAIYNFFFISEEEFDSQGKSRFFAGLLSLLFGVLGFHRLYMKHDLRFFLIFITSIGLGFWCYQSNEWLYFLIWVGWFAFQGLIYWIRALIAPKDSELGYDEFVDFSELAYDERILPKEPVFLPLDRASSKVKKDPITAVLTEEGTKDPNSFKWKKVEFLSLGEEEVQNDSKGIEGKPSSTPVENINYHSNQNNPEQSVFDHKNRVSKAFKGQNPDTLYWVEEEDEFPMDHLTDPVAIKSLDPKILKETTESQLKDYDIQAIKAKSMEANSQIDKVNVSQKKETSSIGITKEGIRKVFRSVPLVKNDKQTKVIVKSPFDQETFKAVNFDSETLDAYELYPTHIAGLKALQVSSPMWSKAQTSQTLIKHFKEMLNIIGKQLAQDPDQITDPENQYLLEFFRNQVVNEQMTRVLQILAVLCENILLSSFLPMDRLSSEDDFDRLRIDLADLYSNEIADYYFSQLQA